MYDVAVVGAGHNALVCACYLARAGRRVVVLERRPVVGGAVCTEEVIPGYRIDTGSSAHIMIHHTPIVEELRLAEVGLEYIDMDPWAFFPDPEGGWIAFYKDLDHTCESIRRVSPRDAAAYRQFVRFWSPIADGVFQAFQQPPTPWNFARTTAMRFGGGDVAESLRRIMTSYGQLIRETFESRQMRGAMAWLGAQSGPPPTETATGPFLGWYAAMHRHGAKHPRGGSGMLAQALARRLASCGGEVRTDVAVSGILVENGKAAGVRLHNGETVRARCVVSGAHVQTTFSLLPPNVVPRSLKRRVENVRVGNGFGMTVRCAADALPDYTGCAGAGPDAHTGLQLLCPSLEYLERSYGDYLTGRPSRQPAVLAMTFSAIDDDIAPPGKHTCYLWAQYYPYALAEGDWDAIRESEADQMQEVLARFAPNMRDAITARFVQSPVDLERRFGLLHGNVMHVEMSLDNMFSFRPLPELSRYATPVGGLFLTGASTHPGGGVSGMSGRNAARAVLAAT